MYRRCFVFLLVFSFASSAFAQGASVPASSMTTEEIIETFRTLIAVHQSIERGEDDQRGIRKKLKRMSSLDERNKVSEELSSVGKRIGELELDLEEIATGVEQKSFNTRAKMKFDWAEELQDLVGPIVHELRGLTARPRELERLRREVDYYERRRLPVFKNAIENLRQIEDNVPRASELMIEEEKVKTKELEQCNEDAKESTSRIAALEKELKALKSEDEENKAKISASITRLTERLSKLALDKSSLEATLAANKSSQKALGKLKQRLVAIREKWEDEKEQTENSLTVAKHQLSEKLGEKIPLRESAHNLFALFFRSRGRNLIVALLTLAIVFMAFRLFHRFIYRVSPFHRQKQRSFYIRLADVFFHVVTLLGTSGAALLVLYMYGDWVLLGLSMILIFGVVWAASRGLPIFWTQTQLLLNLGTVREGERVVVNSIPWKVESINIYTSLSNPTLSGAKLRVPIQDLVDMRSRPVGDHEPWFPSREGDWVLLSDGTYGKVVVQTPEMVQLVLFGGSKKTYGTADFLGQVPLNLSLGFSVVVTFGVDYEHQRIVTTEIPEKMCEDIGDYLKRHEKDEFLESLKVEFKEAGGSSLDLAIITTFKGKAADQYFGLRRQIQRAAVESCNRNKWNIPFPQLTIHGSLNN